MKEKKYSTYEIRVRAVNAVHEGMAVDQVAQAYCVDRSTLYRWLTKQKNKDGNAGLIRMSGSGRPRKLQELTCNQLQTIVLKPASDFGYETDFWTCGRLRHTIETKFNLSISKWTVWRRLRESGFNVPKAGAKVL